MYKLKVLDLFSGIGGFSYGLEKTGLYETVAFCEWDKKCQAVLNKHWPSIPKFSDIANLVCFDPETLTDIQEGVVVKSKVDVITGGFPCQDISLAGKGAGIEGERSGYWRHYKRLIKDIQPKGVIIENVSALRNRGLDQVLQDLNEIGYDAEWHCIPASHCGAPHSRDRIWILAYCRSSGRKGHDALRVLPEDIGQVGRQEKWGSKKLGFSFWDNPYEQSSNWPQPLLRGVDVRLTGRVDRLKQVGNSVYWPIVQGLGVHLHRNLVDV